MDVLGGPDTYNHFPTGWAAAFSAPFKMFKRYSQYAGGTNDPLVISWPKGIKAKGEIRHQYHHSTDIVPTLLEACGIEIKRDNDLMRTCGACLQEALELGKLVKHRNGDEGIDEGAWLPFPFPIMAVILRRREGAPFTPKSGAAVTPAVIQMKKAD